MVNLVPAAVRLQTRFRSRIQEIQDRVQDRVLSISQFWLDYSQTIARKEKSTFQKTKYLSDKRKNLDV